MMVERDGRHLDVRNVTRVRDTFVGDVYTWQGSPSGPTSLVAFVVLSSERRGADEFHNVMYLYLDGTFVVSVARANEIARYFHCQSRWKLLGDGAEGDA